MNYFPTLVDFEGNCDMQAYDSFKSWTILVDDQALVLVVIYFADKHITHIT